MLKLMLGRVGESKLVLEETGEHWELCPWFWLKSMLTLNPLQMMSGGGKAKRWSIGL
jgi:hypothetical protein